MKLGIVRFAEVNLTMPSIHVENKTKQTSRSTQNKPTIQSNHQNPQTPNATHNSPETMCKF